MVYFYSYLYILLSKIKGEISMKKKNLVEFPGITDDYDDDNIPKIDLPGKNRADMDDDRPRQDGPGGA